MFFYSGIVRMLDLALGVPEHSDMELFPVAPDAREEDVRAQLARLGIRPRRQLEGAYL